MNPCEKFDVLCWRLWWDDIGLSHRGENFRLPQTHSYHELNSQNLISSTAMIVSAQKPVSC